LDSEDEEEEEGVDDEAMRNAKYSDFFDPPGKAKKKRGLAAPALKQRRKRSAYEKPARGVLAGDGSGSEGMDDDDMDALVTDGEGEEERQAEPALSSDDDDDLLGAPSTDAPSAHERRLARLAERATRLEHEAVAERAWHLRGEVGASARPKNSALELDLEWDTTVRPPPQPTVEATRSLEDLIRARIAEGRFNDVIKMAPSSLPERKKSTLDLNDKKSEAGLGEVYEKEFVRATAGGQAEDKDDEVRRLARVQFA
jgi:U3 small nucleolar RNA-associated protein MPP10